MTRIIRAFIQIFNILPRRRKYQFLIILIATLCMSVGETIVLGGIAFFASLISDTEKVLNNEKLLYIIDLIDYEPLADPKNLIICVSILVVFLVASKNITKAIVGYLSIRFSTIVEGLFAKELLSGFLQMHYEWHLSQNSADLILVTANWRNYIGRQFVSSVLLLSSDGSMVVIMLITLIVVQPLVSIIVISILGTTSFLLLTSVRRKLDRVALEKRNYDQTINEQSTKMIHGFKDVKISGKKDMFLNQYNKSLLHISWIEGTQRVIAGLPTWLLETMGFFMISFSICFMLFFLGHSVAMVSGTITLLAVTAWRVLPALNRILGQITKLRNIAPYVEKMLGYYSEIQLNQQRNMENNAYNTSKSIVFKAQIHLKDISFTYHNANQFALKNIHMTIKKGSIIGIIGHSGAGKSTLVDILSGMLHPTYGKVFVDDIELNSEALRQLWTTKLGYVPQTPYIFDGTVAENIAFEIDQKRIDKNRVLQCCQMAAMNDFLNDLPSGINSYIGERGVRLSGGQRQRISIARTLYQEPELIIFDEATSSLDNMNEKIIQNTIYSLRGKQTVVIIAHRLTTVESCDIIFELEKGTLKNMGTPQEILK